MNGSAIAPHARGSGRTRGLVLVRAGSASLHPRWLENGARDWDVVVVPYEELPAGHEAGCEVLDIVPGPKWTGLREALTRWDGWREYDHIWMPDDDIATDRSTITAMFEAAAGARLDLFAPALHEASYYAHYSTMVNRRFQGRLVGFVEIMVPGFSRPALEELLWTLDLTATGWGWGLDSLWPKLLGYRNVGILDATPVLHTRPVGQVRDVALQRRVLGESDRILSKYACRQIHTTFAELGGPLALENDAPRLLAELVTGWQYLIDRDPRVLAWIAECQRPQPGWPAYPIAGTPEVRPVPLPARAPGLVLS
jgi:hypothetical protein